MRAYLEDAVTQVLTGEIKPGQVFDRTITLEDAPAGYQAMNDREALKVIIAF